MADKADQSAGDRTENNGHESQKCISRVNGCIGDSTWNSHETIQYEEADAFLLVQIAENAEVAMNTIHLGLSAVGHILARAAPEVETGEISGDATEALGWLLAELGDFAATAFCLSAACRRHTADFAPPAPRTIASARP